MVLKMKIRNKVLLLIAAVILLIAAGVPDNTPQAAYIRKYAEVAVREMYRSGVPASITLAQGLLESGAGKSSLATEGNNHFGIKCHDWSGKKMYHDDDRRGECFRVYGSADESFRDHSDFLRYRDRYKSLFDNDITDYKAWAHGLKKAGYATDPSYPSKLIKVIEDYHLYDYDKMKPADFHSGKASVNANVNETKVNADKSGEIYMPAALTKKQKREERRAEKSTKKVNVNEESSESVIPASPHALEEPKRYKSKGKSEVFSFALTRQVYSMNGVPFVYSEEGESYGSIADKFNLFPREILKFNDATRNEALAPETIVYIQQKKGQAPKGLDKYISDNGGESLHDLSQRFGIKLSDLCKLNSCAADYVTVPGDEIKLRK